MKEFYELIDHTADLGIKVEGDSLAQLFENAAFALIHLIFGQIPKPGEKTTTASVSIEGEDLSDLMVNWLSEVLYLFEGEKKIVCNIKVSDISENRLRALLTLIDFDREKHAVQCEIKAVTYHQLSVTQENSRWKATVIFDV
jgi:SHS2 domain-containing protein